jgi:hypothetical protein
VCAFTPEHKTRHCSFTSAATRSAGGEYALLPHGRKYQLYFNRTDGVVRCEDDEVGANQLLGTAGPNTKLSVRAVKGLARGRSVSVSGTRHMAPAIRDVTGGETLVYKLKVKRVR